MNVLISSVQKFLKMSIVQNITKMASVSLEHKLVCSEKHGFSVSLVVTKYELSWKKAENSGRWKQLCIQMSALLDPNVVLSQCYLDGYFKNYFSVYTVHVYLKFKDYIQPL